MAGRVRAEPALEGTLDIGEKFRPDVSLLWSPCGQAAWDELRKYHHLDKIEMTPRSTTAEVLNVFVWDRDKTLPNGTVIFGGDDSETFRKKIREDLLKRCGPAAARMIGPFEPPGPVSQDGHVERIKSALFVCAMARNLRFPGSFTDDAHPKSFLTSAGKTCPALGFGTTAEQSASYGESVRVLHDDLKGTFCLRLSLAPESKGDQEYMVLLREGALSSFDESIRRVREIMKQERKPSRTIEWGGQQWNYTDTLEANDVLWMPELHAALDTDFGDLVGKRYLQTGALSDGVPTSWWWELREARQLLNFRLNHQGALVQAVFKIPTDFLTSTGGSPGTVTPAPRMLPKFRKTFVFDKPFVATFWKEGADYPYLACWVSGPDLLVGKR